MVKNHSRISLCLIQGHTAISVAILNPITDLFTGSSEDRVQADHVKDNTTTTTTTTTTNTSSDRNTSSPAKQTTPSATTTSTKQPTNTSSSNTRVSHSTFILF